MKFIFLKTGNYLELEPNNTLIASAWFEYIFSKQMNMSYFARDASFVTRTNDTINNLNSAIDVVNQFAVEKNLPQIIFDKISSLDQMWLNAAHKKWVRYTSELRNVVNGDDTKQNYPNFVKSWQNINLLIHSLENYYSAYFTNTKGAYLEDIKAEIRPEDCEYAQHDLILRFDDLGKHQYDQWLTDSSVDWETSNYKRISARFEYTFNSQAIKGVPANPDYVNWCAKNNLQVLPPTIVLGNFKKNRWEVKQLMHQNLSQGLEVGFEL